MVKADDVCEERHSPVIIKSNGFCRPKADGGCGTDLYGILPWIPSD